MPGTKAHRPQPIKSWTEKSAKAYDKVKENGNVSSPRGLYNKGRTAIPVKSTVGGEWELQTCQEFTEWANNILKRQKHRLIADLKKSLSDGITLVNLLEVLFKEKVGGIQTRPIIRAQRVENIHLCLRFLHGRRIEIQDIDSQQIADGNLRVGLLLITRLRKRFDSKLITSSDSHFVNGSIYSGRHGDMDYVNNNGFQNPGREGSIHSFVSGASNPSQGMLPDLSNSYDSGQFKKLRSASFTEKPETVLPGGAFGGEDNLDATPERLGDIVSTTQLDSAGVLQHKSVEFQTRQNQSRNVSLDVEMSKMLLNNVVDDNDDDNGSQLHVNNSMNAPQPPTSVEERLKSLLEMPNPGGYTDLGDPQDEGEFLELPPPDASVYFEGEDTLDDEDRLQAMLEDPDNFDDYPKDWDRYISGYVPSHATEKREGPRAQVMLERSPSPNGASRYQEPFFHGPPREHLGPSQGTTAQSQPIPGYSNRSQSQPLPSYLNQSGSIAGVVYSEEEAYQNYSGQEGIHPPAVNDASFNERRLPTYQDHMQRRVNGSVQRLKSSGSSPHSSGYDSRGHVSPSMSGPGHMRSKAEPQRNGYHKQRQLERPHSMQRQYFNSRNNQRETDFMNSTFPQNQPNIYENNGTPQEYDPYGAVASTSTIDYRYPPQTNPPPSSGYPPNWKRRSLGETASDFTQDYEIYSGSSSRSHTPTLPALSPTETPPTSPPVRNKTRAISADMGRINLNFSKSPNSQQRNREHSRSKRSNEKRPNQRKAAEPKVTVKRTGGKSKRKNLKGSKQDSPESKRSLRALPSLPLHRVQERSEDTDSDDSSDFHPKAELSRLRKEEAATSVREGNGEEATSPATNAGRDHDGAEIDALREQLSALENMYKEMLKVVGAKKAEGKISSPRGNSGSLKKGPGVARSASKVKPNSYRPSVKQREKDVKAINKRFSRVESHVVTLARSVASLSSELRSQGPLVQVVEDLREELDQVQELHLLQQSELSPLRSPYRMSAPLATKPKSIKKLTKFFGEEPPLLTLFLTELGYDKYSSVFEKAGVGLQELPYLTGEQLEKLGIPLGPRTRIIQESQLMV